MSSYNNKRPQFQKKNPYMDRHESKLRDINRSLVHKARLKKNYFKELERSGEQVPEKQIRPRDTYNYQNRRKEDLTYEDRSKIAKARREDARKEREQRRAEYQRVAEQKRNERVQKKEKLSAKTRTGQPLMGPRIENLLDKIKKDYTD